MTASLSGAASTFGEAMRALDRAISASRGQWNDGARQTFDRRHSDRLVSDAKRTHKELEQLAHDLDQAMQQIVNLP